jgi:hypothetical protein
MEQSILSLTRVDTSVALTYARLVGESANLINVTSFQPLAAHTVRSGRY